MALSYRTRRTIVNATVRSFRDPRQLIGLLVVVSYVAINLGVVVALLALPLPQLLIQMANSIVPGGVRAQLPGVRGALKLLLLSLSAGAAFENPLLQFGQADIDLLFPTPIPSWRLLLGRLLSNHLRALAAAYFFWGLTIAPLLRFSDLAIWPGGAWALLGLTCLFVTVDQVSAATLIWLSRRGAARWLSRAGLVLIGVILIGALVSLAGFAASGTWRILAAFVGGIGGLLGGIVFPIGFAVDILTAPAHPGAPVATEALALLGLNLLSGAALIAIGSGHVREAAVSPLGEHGLLRRAFRRSNLNPISFVRLAWSPELLPADDEGGAGLPPFGRGATALLWARLAQMLRAGGRTLVALLVVGGFPLAIIAQGKGGGLGTMVAAIIFSASLATQLFTNLRDHLTGADLDLALPVPRWRLPVAGLLAQLSLYWTSGLILIVGAALLGRIGWLDAVLLLLWHPLVVVPQLGFRGTLLFVFPAAMLPGRRDPVQYVIVMLVNSLLTAVLLGLSLLPVGVLATLTSVMHVSLLVVWAVLYLCGAALTVLAMVALAVAYHRFEPGEGY
ncbi:MAG: putative ABC exporter domain-containing protein [Roseiflexaceae bacterium]